MKRIDFDSLDDNELLELIWEITGWCEKDGMWYSPILNYWNSALPDFIEDMNHAMRLVTYMYGDKHKSKRGDFILLLDRETGLWYAETPDDEHYSWSDKCVSPGRAISIIFCKYIFDNNYRNGRLNMEWKK